MVKYMPMLKLLLSSLLLLTPITTQATTTEEISMQTICEEVMLELELAVDNGVISHTEAEILADGCAKLI